MRRMALMMMMLLVAVTVVRAQDAVTTLPDSYKLQFENAWVRVVRVHYAPHVKLPGHTHTELASAYVYLNDSGPVAFKHVGLSYGAVTRPPTKAGSFRLYRGLKEIHEVENLSPLPSDFLRVEFKTDPVDVATLRGRFFRDAAPAPGNLVQTQFENRQVQIDRLTGAISAALQVPASAAHPSLLILLAAADLGKTQWLDAGNSVTLPPVAGQRLELLRITLKTQPTS